MFNEKILYKKISLVLVIFIFNVLYPVDHSIIHLKHDSYHSNPVRSGFGLNFTFNNDKSFAKAGNQKRQTSFYKELNEENSYRYKLDNLLTKIEQRGLTNRYYESLKQFPKKIQQIEAVLNAIYDRAQNGILYKSCGLIEALTRFDFRNNAFLQNFEIIFCKLDKVLCDSNGFLKSYYTKKELQNLKNIIDEFTSLSIHLDYPSHYTISQAEIFLEPNKNQLLYIHNDKLRDFNKMQDLCRLGDFRAAYDIVQKYENAFTDQNCNYYRENYLRNFYQKYDTYGIDKKFLSDPYLTTVHLEPLCIPSTLNTTLQTRYEVKETIITQLHLSNPSIQTQKISYEIVDLYKSNPALVIEYVCDQLSCDHADICMQQVYHDFFQDGLCKLGSYNELVKNISISPLLYEAQYTQERKLLHQLGLLEIHSADQLDKLSQAIRYLQLSCSSVTHASAYTVLYHTVGNQLLQANGYEYILADFSMLASNIEHEIIRQNLVPYIAHMIMQASDIQHQPEAVLKRISDAYNAMLHGDLAAQIYLSSGINCHPELFSLDPRADLKIDNGGSVEIIHTKIQEVTTAFQSEAIQGTQIYEQHYSLSTGLLYHLHMHEINPDRYSTFCGSQLAHVLHRFDLENLEMSAQDTFKGLPKIWQKVFDLTLQTNFLVNPTIKAHNYYEAFMMSSSVCKTYHAIAQAAKIGFEVACDVKDGVVQNITGLYHAVRHPNAIFEGIAQQCQKSHEFDLAYTKLLSIPFLDESRRKEAIANYELKLSQMTGGQKTWHDTIRETASFLIPIPVSKIVKFAKITSRTGLNKISQFAKQIKQAEKLEIAAAGIKLQVGKACRSLNNAINKSPIAILRNGYYEVNGFKISEYYYKKIWKTGRGAPTLMAKEILKNYTKISEDLEKLGFYRYEYNKWELVYNPLTKEIWHIQPIKK